MLFNFNLVCEAVRGVNPVLQVIFTFSQMYFVFMNARVSYLTRTAHAHSFIF